MPKYKDVSDGDEEGVICINARLVPYDDPQREWPHVLAARCSATHCADLASGFRKIDAGIVAVCPKHGGPMPERE